MSPELLARMFDAQALLAVAPLLVLTAGVCLLLLVEILPLARTSDSAVTTTLRRLVFGASIAGAALFELRILRGEPILAFSGSLLADRASALWGLLFLSSALIAWCFAQKHYREERGLQIEHDVLILCSTVGMMMMAGARDLLVFFIGLELLSVPLYTLAGFQRARTRSVEAGIKYFVLGAFATAIFLNGAALLYTATGTISLDALRGIGANQPLALVGTALIAASLFFKISVFPFHLWVPDVYQGSPTPVTTLMATGTKAAGFAFLLNAMFLLPRSAALVVAGIALATMAAGNLGALVQTDLKRMLAYSGIAHAGTLLLAVAGGLAGDPVGDGALHAALFYMAAYVFTAGGAFGLIALLEGETRGPVTLETLRGLAQRRPMVALAMALFMLSLGGIPATGGFLGKYFVFAVAVRAELFVPAVIGVLLSVVALGYYLRVVVAMYMQPTQVPALQQPPRWIAACSAAVCAAMVIALGVLPGWFLAQLR